jgi:hypothetical protein
MIWNPYTLSAVVSGLLSPIGKLLRDRRARERRLEAERDRWMQEAAWNAAERESWKQRALKAEGEIRQRSALFNHRGFS